MLADDAHVELEKKNVNSELEKTKNTLYEINREAGIYFYRNLFNNRRAYDYLINRDIDKATIKTFGVGYASDSWNSLLDYLKDKNYTEVDIEKAGLVTHHKKTNRYFDKFRDRIMFPIMNTRGKIIGFGGRSIDNSNQPKYLNSPETPVFSKRNNLYALNVVKKNSRSDKIILVEGYMDVLALYKYGILNSVASLGTALTENQVELLKRYKEIYICYDSDNAGKKATSKAIDVMKNMSIRPKIIPLPENLDPDDFMKKYGVSEFENLMENSLTSIDFKINQKKNMYNIKSYQGKIDFVKDVSVLLRAIKSPVELEVYVGKISKETDIPSSVIKQEINKDLVKKSDFVSNNKYKSREREVISPVQYMIKPAHLSAEKELLSLIIKNKDIYVNIKDKFKSGDFLDTTNRKLAELVYDSYDNNEDLTQVQALEHFEETEQSRIKEIFNLRVNKDSKAIEDYIKNINYNKIAIEKENIKKQINILDSKTDKTSEDIELFNELCLKLIQIDKGLKIN